MITTARRLTRRRRDDHATIGKSTGWRGWLSKHRFLIGIVALIAMLIVNAVSTGFDLAMRLSYLLIILVIISWVWSRVGVTKMSAHVNRPNGPFSVGDTLSERITIQNANGAPKSWVEVEDYTTLPNVEFKDVTSFGFMVTFRRVEMSASLTQRGVYELGPLVIRASDPFGLFPRDVAFEGIDRVLVYPQVVPIPDIAASNVLLAGEHARRQRMNVLSTDVSSVREYADGDPIGRIHWLTTARTGSLMVKQFDQGSSGDMWVVFDQHVEAQAGSAKDSTDEYGATIAASIVDKYTRTATQVGYVAQGSETLFAMPEHTSAHRDNILRHIAASRPEGRAPIIDVLAQVDRELYVSSTVIVITAASDGEWVDALGSLQRRGVRTICIAMDRESFGGEPNDDVLARLPTAGVATYRIAHGDVISEALRTSANADMIAEQFAATGESNTATSPQLNSDATDSQLYAPADGRTT